MSLSHENFRTKFLNEDKSLKEEYLIVYTYSSGFSEYLRRTSLFVYTDLSFELKLRWFKYPIREPLLSVYKNNLIPEDLSESIIELNSIEKLELKELYSTFQGEYTPEDVSHSSLYFQHKGDTHSVNTSSYLNGQEKFVTPEEQLVLQISNQMRDWERQLFCWIRNEKNEENRMSS